MTNTQNLELLNYLSEPRFDALLRQHLNERRAIFLNQLVSGATDDNVLRGRIREIDEMIQLSVVLDRIVKKNVDDQTEQ